MYLKNIVRKWGALELARERERERESARARAREREKYVEERRGKR